MVMITSKADLASDIAQLQLISTYMNTTFAFMIFFSGVIGNVLNILTLFTLGNYKHNASSLYILTKSFFDLSALVFSLFMLILTRGIGMNSMSTNYVWCKARIPLVYVSAFGSFTCLCLQSIDVFLATSYSAYWRGKSNVRTARLLIIGFLFVWIAHESPYFFLQDVINFKCVSSNAAYTQYRTYFLPFGYFTLIPIMIISSFGYLSYRHVKNQLVQARKRTLSRLTTQMTRIALFQIVIVFMFSSPFAIAQAYFLATANVNKDAYQQAQEQLAQYFFNAFLSGLYAGPFYFYCIASKQYREQVVDAVKKLFERRHGRKTRVGPTRIVRSATIQLQSITTH